MDYDGTYMLRHDALKIAVDATQGLTMGESDIVAVAKVFEAYLKGEPDTNKPEE